MASPRFRGLQVVSEHGHDGADTRYNGTTPIQGTASGCR